MGDRPGVVEPPVVAVLATLDSKSREAASACYELRSAGARPWVLDLSLRPHGAAGADVTGDAVAEAGGSDWKSLASLGRGEAAEVMVRGGRKLLAAEVDKARVHAAVGLGGANGTSLACDIMRDLPLLFPKLMVSVVASTAAVQWYVGASDIVMFPSVGDLSLNRVVVGVIKNASVAAAAMARAWREQPGGTRHRPLVGVSSFGGTADCVQRVEERLEAAGYEVILFHASGPGGRALERLARTGELSGVIDVTTHELVDLVVGGVYSAGEARLQGAGERGIPQVVVPGALDHANFWVGQVPERFREREFFQYNRENLLMRTNAEEYEVLAGLIADRVNAAAGPAVVLIPRRGFSEHSSRRTYNLAGDPIGSWHQPEVDAHFVTVLRQRLEKGHLKELDLHVNDPEFADECAAAFFEIAGAATHASAPTKADL